MDPFDIMPVAMYEAILNKLDLSWDKLNLVRTNSQLENAFRPMINAWQFEAVMPLLIIRCNLLTPTPAYNEVFRNCRLVSSRICKVIDAFTEACLNHKYLWYAPFFTNVAYLVSSQDKAATFLREIEHHPSHRSPILSKSLILFLMKLPRDIEAKNGVYKQLVSKVGNHLSRVELDVEITSEMGRSLNFIKDLLTLTPNLRSLSLEFSDYGDTSLDLENGVEDIMLPALPNLQQLSVQTYHNREFHLPLNFSLWFHGLRVLKIGIRNWKDQYNSENLFPMLEKLDIDSIDLPGDDQGKVVQLLENFNASPTFRRLSLNCFLRPGNDSQTEEFNKCVDMLKTLALSTVKKSRPECKWKTSERLSIQSNQNQWNLQRLVRITQASHKTTDK